MGCVLRRQNICNYVILILTIWFSLSFQYVGMAVNMDGISIGIRNIIINRYLYIFIAETVLTGIALFSGMMFTEFVSDVLCIGTIVQCVTVLYWGETVFL